MKCSFCTGDPCSCGQLFVEMPEVELVKLLLTIQDAAPRRNMDLSIKIGGMPVAEYLGLLGTKIREDKSVFQLIEKAGSDQYMSILEGFRGRPAAEVMPVVLESETILKFPLVSYLYHVSEKARLGYLRNVMRIATDVIFPLYTDGLAMDELRLKDIRNAVVERSEMRLSRILYEMGRIVRNIPEGLDAGLQALSTMITGDPYDADTHLGAATVVMASASMTVPVSHQTSKKAMLDMYYNTDINLVKLMTEDNPFVSEWVI